MTQACEPAIFSLLDATNLRVRGSKSKKIKKPYVEQRPAVKTLFLITFLCLFGAGALAQSEKPAPADGIDEVYLAKDDGSGKAGEKVTEFGTADIPIYCVVLLSSNASAVVRMNFVAANVSGVKFDTNLFTTTYTTKQGQNRVNFMGRPEGKWTPGKYRVDLFLDGKKTREVGFMIKGDAEASGNTTAVKNFQKTETPKPKPKKPRSSK